MKNIEDLKITYKQGEIDSSLIHLRGSFLNIGNRDIDKTMIYDPLTISLPMNYSWLQVKVTEQSPSVKVKHKASNDNITFEWDLMKTNEYFTFEALIQDQKRDLLPERPIEDKLIFTHRIKDQGPITKMSYADSKKRGSKLHLLYISILYLTGIFWFWNYFPFTVDKYGDYVILDGKQVPITQEEISVGKYRIKSLDGNFQEEGTLLDLHRKFDISFGIVGADTSQEKKSNFLLGIGGNDIFGHSVILDGKQVIVTQEQLSEDFRRIKSLDGNFQAEGNLLKLSSKFNLSSGVIGQEIAYFPLISATIYLLAAIFYSVYFISGRRKIKMIRITNLD